MYLSRAGPGNGLILDIMIEVPYNKKYDQGMDTWVGIFHFFDDYIDKERHKMMDMIAKHPRTAYADVLSEKIIKQRDQQAEIMRALEAFEQENDETQ